MLSTYLSLCWLPHGLPVLHIIENKRHEWWPVLGMQPYCSVGTDGYRRRTCAAYRINGCAKCVPSLTKKAFITIEKRIGQWWWALFEESMQQADAEEKAITISNEKYHQGIQ